ncbi:hypothetical protein PHYBLDRAFT_58974 [Phycomyces blakesleeanus NRRL 1555(-)]|uniref:Uncharacterized protein n=1 Tax=Phycomyces blakesleeanus (strain ATCC 8743b / DSM 1359 / FGSC 10004 / NBRC 33097 / NRRL 1555) TaxID=763407 RepID=A0A167QMK4_PHYB8|nr:hypothetical protein PHYBLDRAFT_58974 [Phycomyces blakesleeanus NRRL 1555(-)]OAD79931.1 hypothetical protein PHYBLDRAFT_58974 [Phycomyces blakesleeanus NRRL 1555(-)]|eukprot:XP_018297971.1 hypothetical protein PHYBLDRAFT_58974 [Phycomyces blakesleeanus NRRL 1555(-)]
MNQQQLRGALGTVIGTSQLCEEHPALQAFVYQLRHGSLTDHVYQDTLYQNQADQLLVCLSTNSYDKASLNTVLSAVVSSEANTKDPSVDSFRRAIVQFLINQLQNSTNILPTLQFISENSARLFTSDQPKGQVFKLCFELQTTHGYWDLEVRSWLYRVFRNLRVPTDQWLAQAESSPQYQSRKKYVQIQTAFNDNSTSHRLKDCQDLLEGCLASPSNHIYWAQKFAEILPYGIVSESVSIQTNISLYQTIYPLELEVVLNALKSIWGSLVYHKLSDETQSMLQAHKNVTLLLDLETDALSDQFLDSTSCLSLDPALVDLLNRTLGTPHSIPANQIEKCIHELCLVIDSAPQIFLAHITRCAIMLTFLSSLVGLMYSSWANLLACLLDQITFEAQEHALEMNLRLKFLAKVASCCVVYLEFNCRSNNSQAISEFVCELGRMWQHYRNTRMIILDTDEPPKDQDYKVKVILFNLINVAKEKLNTLP